MSRVAALARWASFFFREAELEDTPQVEEVPFLNFSDYQRIEVPQ